MIELRMKRQVKGGEPVEETVETLRHTWAAAAVLTRIQTAFTIMEYQTMLDTEDMLIMASEHEVVVVTRNGAGDETTLEPAEISVLENT